MFEVLLVHSDKAIRNAWRKGLVDAGCTVIVAARPLKAFESGLRHDFNIVLTGYQFPDGMTGIQFARTLRTSKTGMIKSNTPIVLLSQSPLADLPEGVTAILPEAPEMDGFANVIALIFQATKRKS